MRKKILHNATETLPTTTLNEQITRAYHTLAHEMFKQDTPLFARDLKDMMTMHSTAKQLWLQAVNIAVHNYTIIYKHTPAQHQITQYFTQPNRDNDPQDNNQPVKLEHTPDWAYKDNWESNQLILKKKQ
eukprot:7298689-Ditylum_brightwellii.AAC.1